MATQALSRENAVFNPTPYDQLVIYDCIWYGSERARAMRGRS